MTKTNTAGTIVVDLNKITKRQMLEWRRGRQTLRKDEDLDPEVLERHDFENLYKPVIQAWPYGDITFENFLDLPLPEATHVDNVVSDAINGLSEKK